MLIADVAWHFATSFFSEIAPEQVFRKALLNSCCVRINWDFPNTTCLKEFTNLEMSYDVWEIKNNFPV